MSLILIHKSQYFLHNVVPHSCENNVWDLEPDRHRRFALQWLIVLYSSTPLLHPHQRHKADLTSAMLQCSESELTAAHHRQTSLLTKNFRFLKYIHTKQLGIEIYEFFILQFRTFWRQNTKHSLLDSWCLQLSVSFTNELTSEWVLGRQQASAFESSAI